MEKPKRNRKSCDPSFQSVFIRVLVLLLFLVPVSCKTTSTAQKPPAPQFADLDVYGEPFDLNDFQNKKNVVLVFYVNHA
jgi:hypothetical protein